MPDVDAEHDLFISYAAEDRSRFVAQLIQSFWTYGVFSLWFDEISLQPAASIRKSIEAGLCNSRYFVAVITPSYMKKHWTGLEFESALSLKRQIIPIWHKVNSDGVLKFSPILHGIKAIKSDIGAEAVSERIVDILEKDQGSAYAKGEDRRTENMLFWEMVHMYVRYILGLSDGGEIRRLNRTVRGTGAIGDFIEHIEDSLGISSKEIHIMRNGLLIDGLTDGEMALAVVCALQEREFIQKKAWFAQISGAAELRKKVQMKNKKCIT